MKLLYFLPLIVAIWFGYKAYKTERNVLGWAINGGILSIIGLVITPYLLIIFIKLGVSLQEGQFFILPLLYIILHILIIRWGNKIFSIQKINFGKLKSFEIDGNWSVQAGSKFIIKKDDDGDYILEYNDNQVVFSINNNIGKSKEKLYLEIKESIQKEINELKLDEFEFNIDNKILYGFSQQGKENNTNELYQILKTYTFVDDEFIVITFYFKNENQINWAINMWKHIENKKNEEIIRIKEIRETLKENEVIVKIIANGKIEKWNMKDWDEVVKIGNSSKFELK